MKNYKGLKSFLIGVILLGLLTGCAGSGENQEKVPENETVETLGETSINSDILVGDAEILAGDLVNYVMDDGWLSGSHEVTDEDIVRFLSSIAPHVSRGEESYPYFNSMTLSEDKMYYLIKLGDAQKIALELFGVEDFSAESFPDGTFDEAEQVFKVSAEIDTWSSKFDYRDMSVTAEGEYLSAYIARIYAECGIVNDSTYDECDYGTYRFTFEQMDSGDGSFLRLKGLEKIS